MAESLWQQWRGRVPTATDIEMMAKAELEQTARTEALELQARKTREVQQFAISLIDLSLVRLEELASRESVDTVELGSVVDELRTGRRELLTKISRI